MLTTHEEVLRIEGAGETETLAFQAIFAQVRDKLSQKYADIFLQIEPQGIEVVRARVHTHTERFLGLFFPRRRRRYHLTVNLTVKVRRIDATRIDYEETTEKLSAAQRILKMR